MNGGLLLDSRYLRRCFASRWIVNRNHFATWELWQQLSSRAVRFFVLSADAERAGKAASRSQTENRDLLEICRHDSAVMQSRSDEQSVDRFLIRHAKIVDAADSAASDQLTELPS